MFPKSIKREVLTILGQREKCPLDSYIHTYCIYAHVCHDQLQQVIVHVSIIYNKLQWPNVEAAKIAHSGFSEKPIEDEYFTNIFWPSTFKKEGWI